MAGTAIIANPVGIINNAPISVAVGARSFGPFVIDDLVEVGRVALNRCTTLASIIWPSRAVKIVVTAFVSLDGGLNWLPSGGITDEGGIVLDRFGLSELAIDTYVFSLIPGKGRLFRIDMAVEGGFLTSIMSAEVI